MCDAGGDYRSPQRQGFLDRRIPRGTVEEVPAAASRAKRQQPTLACACAERAREGPAQRGDSGRARLRRSRARARVSLLPGRVAGSLSRPPPRSGLGRAAAINASRNMLKSISAPRPSRRSVVRIMPAGAPKNVKLRSCQARAPTRSPFLMPSSPCRGLLHGLLCPRRAGGGRSFPATPRALRRSRTSWRPFSVTPDRQPYDRKKRPLRVNCRFSQPRTDQIYPGHGVLRRETP